MKIVVLCGGLSNERDVSLSSGNGVANALRDRGHDVVLMDLFFGCMEEYNDPKELFARKRENTVYRVEQTAPDLEAIKAATDEVQKAFYAVSEKLYQQANPQGAQGCDPNCGGSCGSDGVVDADYETVD